MNALSIGGGVVAAALLLGTLADDPPKKDAQAGAESGPQPTAQHKLLARDAGVWDATVTTYMGGPGSQPHVSKGVETSRMMKGGLWLLTDFEGSFEGQAFQGQGQTGYDPKKGKYIGTWIDSMSTSPMVSYGTYDETTKTMTMFGEFDDPASGKATKAKMVTQYKDDGTRLFTMSVQTPESKGEYAKVMEISYKRRSK
jgi:hypothetical protein